MKSRRLLLLAATGVITIGVIAWLVIQRPLMQQPPFSFIPTSDDLIHRQVELKKEEMLGVPGSCRIYSFPADFNSICLQADAELLSQDYKGPVRFTSPINGEEMRLYTCTERVSDTGSARSVRIVNNRISERKWRADDHYSVRVGWVTVEVLDMALTLPLPQSLENTLKEIMDVNRGM
jgi:hypothetical protein